MKEIKISDKEKEKLQFEIDKVIKIYKLNKLMLSIFTFITLIFLGFAFQHLGKRIEMEFAFGSIYVLIGVVIVSKITVFIEKNTNEKINNILKNSTEINNFLSSLNNDSKNI